MPGLLLSNPNARSGEAQSEAVAILRDCGVEVASVATGSPAEAHKAITSYGDQLDFIVAAGGDGTVRSLLSAAVQSGLPLGLLPLGTANDLARTLAVPMDLEGACRVIADGRIRSIDLGVANGHYFANTAGIGLQPEIAKRTSPTAKRWLGPAAYIPAAYNAWRDSRPFRAEITVDAQQPAVIDAMQITVGNGPHYGGGLIVDREATISESLLHVLVVEPVSLTRLLALVPRLYRGTGGEADATEVVAARVVDIATDRRLSVSLDGEPTTETPVHVEIADKVLQVFVGQRAEEQTDGLGAAG